MWVQIGLLVGRLWALLTELQFLHLLSGADANHFTDCNGASQTPVHIRIAQRVWWTHRQAPPPELLMGLW